MSDLGLEALIQDDNLIGGPEGGAPAPIPEASIAPPLPESEIPQILGSSETPPVFSPAKDKEKISAIERALREATSASKPTPLVAPLPLSEGRPERPVETIKTTSETPKVQKQNFLQKLLDTLRKLFRKK